jgi:hydrogenase maturation protease
VSVRILIAGIGNALLGDGGFGVELARRLARESAPEGVTVSEVGARPLHLAYALLDRPDLLLVIDAVRRGEPPGTVYLMDISELAGATPGATLPGYGIGIDTVVTAVWTLGGKSPPILLVGCEPHFVGDRMGLSAAVMGALPKAEGLIRATVARWLGSAAGQPMLIDGIAKSSHDGVWFPSLDG